MSKFQENNQSDWPPPKTVRVSFTVWDMTHKASCRDLSASSRICWVAPRSTIEHASPRATPGRLHIQQLSSASWHSATLNFAGKTFTVLIPHLNLTPPLGGFPSECRHPVWYRKTRMMWLTDGEKISKICLFVLTWSTNVTDRLTNRQMNIRLKNSIYTTNKH